MGDLNMTANKKQIREWLMRGNDGKHSHLIVVCDGFDHENYPVLVKKGENVRKIAKRYDGKNMQRIDEVYNYDLDLETQVNQRFVKNY
jgi:hypothetical protein